MDFIQLNTSQEIYNYIEDISKQKESSIAIDIECEMNLHCYGEHICLIQIFDKVNKILIDPLKFKQKDELNNILKAVFETRNILKITYDSAGDSSIIEKLHGVKTKSVFDLRPAVHLLNYDKQSLSYILNELLSIPMISKKKFQTYNWMKRPIDEKAIEYALSDVVHLFDLKEKLMKKIINNNLLDEYMLLNLMAQNKDYVEPNEEDFFNRRKGYSRLSKSEKVRYKLFYHLREKHAKRLNKSPNFLISNLNLIPLASKKANPKYFLERNVTNKLNNRSRDEFIIEMLETYSIC